MDYEKEVLSNEQEYPELSRILKLQREFGVK